MLSALGDIGLDLSSAIIAFAVTVSIDVLSALGDIGLDLSSAIIALAVTVSIDVLGANGRRRRDVGHLATANIAYTVRGTVDVIRAYLARSAGGERNDQRQKKRYNTQKIFILHIVSPLYFFKRIQYITLL